MNTPRRSFVTASIVLGLAWPAFGTCPDARFATQAVFPAEGTVEGIAVSDFDRDGRLDLAVTQFSAAGAAGNGVAILLGDGNGGFGAPARFEVGRGATRIVAADFNADGDTDVAVLNSNSGTVSILLGDGHGSLGPQTTLPVGGTPIGLALGDFNGDGKADLVVTELFTAQVNVMLGRGDGSFSEPASFPVGQQPLLVATGDVDADGRLDLAVGNALDGTVSILLGLGDGTFAPQVTVRLPGGSTPEGLALADLNGDRVADLAVLDGSHDSVAVFPGRGDGLFGGETDFAVGSLPVFLAVGDVSGDGHPDLAVANVDDGTVSVLVGRGDGTFEPQLLLRAGSEPLPVAMADLDGDGALDIVAGNAGDQTVSILMNTSVRDTAPPEIVSIVARPETFPQTQRGFVPIVITAVASDDCDAAPTCEIVSVTSDPAAPGVGRRTGRIDFILSDPGPKASPASLGLLLRATGPARIYRIDISCADAAGNAVSDRTVVTVTSPPGHPPRSIRSPRF